MTRDTIFADNFGLFPIHLPMSVKEATLKAMDEYAKSQVIAYELWINEMLMDDSSFNYEKTPEQLYSLFLEHQLNNGGE